MRDSCMFLLKLHVCPLAVFHMYCIWPRHHKLLLDRLSVSRCDVLDGNWIQLALVSLFKCWCKIEENLHEKSQEEDLLFQPANVSSARMLAFFFASQWLCGNRHSEKASCKVKALSTWAAGCRALLSTDNVAPYCSPMIYTNTSGNQMSLTHMCRCHCNQSECECVTWTKRRSNFGFEVLESLDSSQNPFQLHKVRFFLLAGGAGADIRTSCLNLSCAIIAIGKAETRNLEVWWTAESTGSKDHMKRNTKLLVTIIASFDDFEFESRTVK